MNFISQLINKFKTFLVPVDAKRSEEKLNHEQKLQIQGEALLKSQQSLLKKEQENILLAQALKSVNDCIVISDFNDKVVFLNDSFLQTYGYTEKDIIGKNISIVRYEGFDPDLSKRIYSDTRNNGWHGEVYNMRKDGSLFPVELWTSVVKDETGKPIATVGVARDITIRKKFEKELIEAKTKAEEMNKVKSNFLSNISHELRTPLVGILGFAELLLDEVKDPESLEMVKRIYGAGKRLSHTLNLVLDLSKIESNKVRIEWKEINLVNAAREVNELFTAAAQNKNINLSFKSSYSEIPIYADERMICDILNNLINNAVKFTNTGEVMVLVGVRQVNNETKAFLSVKDSGIGIPQDKLYTIFEEFRQVSEGPSRGFEGTGLGLTITQKFVDLLGGKIEVKSKPGVGSEFTVYFNMFQKGK